jgi:hypothetical protein
MGSTNSFLIHYFLHIFVIVAATTDTTSIVVGVTEPAMATIGAESAGICQFGDETKHAL